MHNAAKILLTSILTLSFELEARPTTSPSEPPPPSAARLELTLPISISYTEFPPYTYTDNQGVAHGYFVDLIKEMLDQLKISYRFVANPTPRIHYQLKSGELDVYLGPRGVPNLAEHTRMIPLPESFSIKLSLWRRPGTLNIPEVMALQGQNLAIINGFGYGGLITQLNKNDHKIHIVRSSGHETALKMLISGRVNYLLDYQRPVSIELKKHPTVELLNQPIQKIHVAFIISRHVPHSKALYEALRESVENHFSNTAIPTSMSPPPQLFLDK